MATIALPPLCHMLLADLPLEDHTSSSEYTRARANSESSASSCRLVDGSTTFICGSFHSSRLEFREFQTRIKLLADEFFCAMDVPGMVASVAALGCQPFHDELVAALLRGSLDHKEPEREAVVSLLGAFLTEGLLEASELVRGYEKLVLTWEDLQLDVPDVHGRLVALLSSSLGLLDRNLFARLPEDLLWALQDDLPPGAAREVLELHLGELRAFKTDLASTLEEDLFSGRSLDAVAAFLRTSDKAKFHHEVVLMACELSLVAVPSRAAFWMSCFSPSGLIAQKRNIALDMLTQLYIIESDCLLNEVDLQLGFSRLLGIAEKLVQERPDVQLMLVALLRGAVERELLPAEFLKNARRLRYGGYCGVEITREVQRKTPLHSRRSWGSGDVRQLQTEVQEAIYEYLDCRNVEELAHIVQELHLSEIEQVQFVRKLLVAGMERNDGDSALDAVGFLLGPCWGNCEVVAAFEQLRDIADDLVLDFPYCRERTSDLVCAAVGRGLLESSFLLSDVGSTV